jgi:hypothetical protein
MYAASRRLTRPLSRDRPFQLTLLTLKLLLLLGIANGAPIVLNKLLDNRFSSPVDGDVVLPDQRPLFGPSKTWRGIVVAITSCGIAAELMHLAFHVGILFGACAMAGDLFSSFIKRRLNIQPSGMALGLDQIPEALFPLLAIKDRFMLTADYITLLTALFLVLELVISRILFELHIRKEPY